LFAKKVNKTSIILMLYLLAWNFYLAAKADTSIVNFCPLCSKNGEIICPKGFEAECIEIKGEMSEPRCVFFGNKYISGCWKFVGISKVDLDFFILNLPPSYMIEATGGGETYTLNRETIGCRKL